MAKDFHICLKHKIFEATFYHNMIKFFNFVSSSSSMVKNQENVMQGLSLSLDNFFGIKDAYSMELFGGNYGIR